MKALSLLFSYQARPLCISACVWAHVCECVLWGCWNPNEDLKCETIEKPFFLLPVILHTMAMTRFEGFFLSAFRYYDRS